MANSVTLRQRKLPSGNIQLYLDINAGGMRKTEGLGMTLKKGNDRLTKESNRQTLMMAQQIAEQRKMEILHRVNGLEYKRASGPELFYDYFEECMQRRTTNTQNNWHATLRYLEIYEPNKKITFSYIDKDWVEGFRDWLLNDATRIRQKSKKPCKLANNSAAGMYKILLACLHEALADGVILTNPALGVKVIPLDESEREYLTEEELVKLRNTPCSNDNVKRAFLFSCMTGLRYSDVKLLTWAQVRDEKDRTRIVFRQKKTRYQMYQDINSTAKSLLGERGKDEDHVFVLSDNKTSNNYIKRWVKSAGISKYITFHFSRHTCATLLLTKGADIYTTSKILGHTKIQTTQIYGKIVDSKRQSASDLLDDIL